MSKRTVENIFLEGARPYVWIAGLIAIIYAKSIWYGFTYLDDNILILNNIKFLSDLSNIWIAFLVKVFPHSYLEYYRPILTLSFMFDAQISGASLFFYHISNIFFHCAATGLLFAFLTRMGYKREMSFLVSLIFAVHPVLSQGVAWVPGRNDTLLAVFVLGTMLCLMRYLKSGRAITYLGHMLCFALALFVKETALVVMPIALLYMYLIEKESIVSRHGMRVMAGWAIIVVFWGFLREYAIQGAHSMNYYEMGSLIVKYSPVAVQFLGKILFPFNLSVFPIIADTTFIYGVLAVGLIIAALIIARSRRVNFILFGFAWAGLFLAPSLIRANTWLVADFLEPRVYLPIIGCIIVLCEIGIARLFDSHKTIMRSTAVVIITLFSIIAFTHIDNFRDQFSFWANAARTSPHSSFAHLALAIAYHDSGDVAKAEAEYRRCLELDPQQPGALFGMGNIYFRRGMLDEAEKEFRKTIAVYPLYDNGYMSLGAIYYKRGELKKAERAWNKAILINPGNVNAYKNLAIYYYEQKDLNKARLSARQLKELGVKVPEDFLRSIGMK